MFSQKAVFCSCCTLSAIWWQGGRREEPVPVPGPAGWWEGGDQLTRAGSDWGRDQALAKQRCSRHGGKGKVFSARVNIVVISSLVCCTIITEWHWTNIFTVTVSRSVCSSSGEAAASTDNQRQDWSQGRDPFSPTAFCQQQGTFTTGDGNWTSAVSGEWSSGVSHRTLPQRYRGL